MSPEHVLFKLYDSNHVYRRQATCWHAEIRSLLRLRAKADVMAYVQWHEIEPAGCH